MSLGLVAAAVPAAPAAAVLPAAMAASPLALWQIVALNAWFVPLHLAAFWFQDRVLRARSRRALLAARVAVIALVLLLHDALIDPTSVISVLLTAFVMTFACFGGPRRVRAFAACLITGAAVFGELCGTCVWLALVPGKATSSYVASWEHYGAHAAGMTCAIVITAATLALFARGLGRSRAAGNASLGWSLALYPAVQLAGVGLLAHAAMTAPGLGALGATVACVVLSALCIASDLAIFVVADRAQRRELLRREEKQLAARLEETQALAQEDLEHAVYMARLRHNYRDQIQVAGGMAARGEKTRAAAYVRELGERWAQAAAGLSESGPQAAAGLPEEGAGHVDG